MGGCAADASKSAEIVMALDGLLVFATMRGCQNTVSMFLVKDDGTLALLKVAEAPAFPRGMFLPNNFESNTPSTLVVGGQSNTECSARPSSPSSCFRPVPCVWTCAFRLNRK